MFSLQLNTKNISWQLSSVEGGEGGELVERRPVEGSLSLFRGKKKGEGGKERCHRSVFDVRNANDSHGEGRQLPAPLPQVLMAKLVHPVYPAHGSSCCGCTKGSPRGSEDLHKRYGNFSETCLE